MRTPLTDALPASRAAVPSLGRFAEFGVIALLLLSAAVFYLAPWAPIYGPALLAVAALSWCRLDLALGLVVLFAPFFMVPKHIGSREFAPSEIFLLVDCLVALLYVLNPRTAVPLRWRQLVQSPFLFPAVILLLAGAVSTAFAADRHEALRAFREVILEPAAFFALVLLLAGSGLPWRALIAALIAAGLLAGVIALSQLASHQDLTYASGSSLPRLRALYGSPDNLGLLYDRAIPVWFSLAVFPGVFHRFGRLWWALGLIFIPVLVLTFSRGAWLAVAVACVLALVATQPWGRWLAIGSVLLAASALALAGPTVIHALSSGHTNTVHRRLDLWQSSARMLRAHPLLGIGPDNFVHYYAPTRQQDLYQRLCAPGLGYMNPAAGDEPCLSHPHNEFLDFWLSTGLPGLVAFLWLQLVFWRSALQAWRSRPGAVDNAILLGCMTAMLAGLVHGLVDNSYFLPDLAVIFWLLCAFVSCQRTSARPRRGEPA